MRNPPRLVPEKTTWHDMMREVQSASNFAEMLSEALKGRGADADMSAVWRAVHANSDMAALLKEHLLRAYQADPEFKAAKSKRMKALHADPEFAARQRAASSKVMKALNADPEFKAGVVNRIRALHADPEFKAALVKRMKALNADPEVRAVASKRMKALHADPEFKALHSAAVSKAMRNRLK